MVNKWPINTRNKQETQRADEWRDEKRIREDRWQVGDRGRGVGMLSNI